MEIYINHLQCKTSILISSLLLIWFIGESNSELQHQHLNETDIESRYIQTADGQGLTSDSLLGVLKQSKFYFSLENDYFLPFTFILLFLF